MVIAASFRKSAASTNYLAPRAEPALPLPTELGFTRVRQIREWPKSDISDFGWGEGRGEGLWDHR